MGKTLRVANISYSITSEDLTVKFSNFGTVVSADVIRDERTGRSKGLGLVEMATEGQAKAAIDHLNFSQLNGLTLGVREAPRMRKRQ